MSNTITLTKKQMDEIDAALALAINLTGKHSPSDQQTALNAAFAYRRARPDYDPMEHTRRECEKFGCD